MDTALTILNIIALIGFALLGLLWKNSLTTYLSKKGENLATKEDIAEITKQVEEVKSNYAIEMEKLKVDLALLSQKHTILLDEKIRVFKKLQKRLVKFKQYCIASYSEYGEVSEFDPTLESLPKKIDRSALLHITALRRILERDFIFLSEKSKELILDLANNSMLETMELSIHGQDKELISHGAAQAYQNAIEKIDKCLEGLYEELEFPVQRHTT